MRVTVRAKPFGVLSVLAPDVIRVEHMDEHDGLVLIENKLLSVASVRAFIKVLEWAIAPTPKRRKK